MTPSVTLINNDINDTRPSSVYHALEELCEAHGRRVCILGDMPEDGEEWHRELGSYASGRNIDIIIAIGGLARDIFRGALGRKKAIADIEYFPTKKQFIENIDGLIFDGDTLLMKASPEMGFDEIIKELKR